MIADLKWPRTWGGSVAGLYTVGLSHLGSRLSGSDLAAANAAFVFCYAVGTVAGPQAIGARAARGRGAGPAMHADCAGVLFDFALAPLGIRRGNQLAALAQDHLLGLGWQILPGCLQIELVVIGEGFEHLEVIETALVPATNGAARQT